MHPQSQTLLEVHIFMLRKREKNKKHSPEFRVRAIMDMREPGSGYNQTMQKSFPHLLERNFAFLKA